MRVPPHEVHDVLRRSILVEGYPFVLDIDRSHGQYLHDAITSREYLDFFTFYASRPVRFDHPLLLEPEYLRRLERAARIKPSNGDIYTTLYAEFVETFRSSGLGSGMTHLFFVDGGSLAVENALKAAFDWKIQKSLAAGRGERGSKVIHFERAFHGRSGYSLSLTNTADPRKTQYFPRFDWPRVESPAVTFPLEGANLRDVERSEDRALAQIEDAYRRFGDDDIASIIVEPIQCEGGDRHLRASFLKKLRKVCDERETMLIFDEVQTGMGVTGTMWCYEQLGVVPDIVAFAKKAQTGGIMASARLDQVPSVFQVKSRISSTFGGNLVDFVRCQRYLEIIAKERLLENASREGAFLLDRLRTIASRRDRMTNVRGSGLLIAFDLEDASVRDRVVARAQDEGLLVLPCGDRSVRLRPALDVLRSECEQAIGMLERAIDRALGA